MTYSIVKLTGFYLLCTQGTNINYIHLIIPPTQALDEGKSKSTDMDDSSLQSQKVSPSPNKEAYIPYLKGMLFAQVK